MNVLAGYGSGSEDSGDDAVPLAAAAPPATSAPHAKAAIAGGKKVKKLDISFLPPEIQAALVRGDHMSDSESDGEQPARKSVTETSSSATRAATAASERTRHMLKQLPKPQRDTDSCQLSAAPKAQPLIALSGGSADVADSPPRSCYDYSSGSGKNVSYAPPARVSVCAAPPLRNLPSAVQTGQLPLPSSAILGAAPPPHQQHYSAPPSSASATNSKSSRKREREIQQELLNGNVAVVQQSKFVDVSSDGKGWDSSTYNERQRREAEVASMFGQKAGANMIAQPTKAQNRKHQINSLAMSAASVELDLMEARGARSKSKSETQAKYGW